jgi:DNA primase
MRFPPQLLDEIRARLPVSHVVGRRVGLKRKGREFVALSPFKAEKTPSFFVNDQKGFYHCFASGEHGDIFTFLMKTEGVSFPEAVERLAQEAGVPLPAPEARHPERDDERQRLYALLEASARYFEEHLRGAEGAEARRYLEKRGVERAAIARFRLGYAPNSRSALRAALARQGFGAADMATAGMLIAGDDIPVAYDRFRHRLMFPITDVKERVIAFGGRALDPGAQAKYLNSPETPLFHKGQVLFNAATARAPAHAKRRLVAVEGYMDVLALWEAGIAEAVAPLGTALTADQVRLMWRFAPEPILCFDGDAAGRRAAFRAVETVLPHLRPGLSVAFAFLPDGLDPDDLVRQQGAAALEAALARARPLADVLWEREWASGDWRTPERRARLDLQIRQLLARIEDGAVRSHYERAMRERLAETWRATKPGTAGGDRRATLRPFAERAGQQGPRRGRTAPARAGGHFGVPPAAGPSASLRTSGIVAGSTAALPSREALLLRTLLNHPWLIEDHAEEIAALPLTSPALSRLRDAILSVQALDNSLDRAALRSQLSTTSLDRVVDLVERASTHRGDLFAEPGASRGEVEAGWKHALALHERQVGLGRSLEAAERAWHETGSEEAWARICEIQRLSACADGAVAHDDPGDAAR